MLSTVFPVFLRAYCDTFPASYPFLFFATLLYSFSTCISFLCAYTPPGVLPHLRRLAYIAMALYMLVQEIIHATHCERLNKIPGRGISPCVRSRSLEVRRTFLILLSTADSMCILMRCSLR